MRASAVAAVLIGCGAGAKPSAAPPPSPGVARAAPAVAPSAPAPGPAPRAASTIRLEAEPAPATPSSGVRIEFLAPVFGELLPERGFARQEVTVSYDPAALPAGASVVVLFDGLRPLPLTAPGSITLGQLYPEDRPIVPGVHGVVAVAIDAQGKPLVETRANAQKPFAVVDFFVGSRTGTLPRPEQARLFCLSPAGTFHGADGDRPLLQFFTIGEVGKALSLRIDAEGAALDGVVDPSRSYRVIGLPSGDVRIRAGTPQTARAECVSTLNLERRSGS